MVIDFAAQTKDIASIFKMFIT